MMVARNVLMAAVVEMAALAAVADPTHCPTSVVAMTALAAVAGPTHYPSL